MHLKQPAPEAVPGGSAVPFGERKVILPGGHRPTGHLPRGHCSFQGGAALSAVPEFSLTRSSLLFLPLGNTPTAIPKAKIKSRGRGRVSPAVGSQPGTAPRVLPRSLASRFMLIGLCLDVILHLQEGEREFCHNHTTFYKLEK